ncbi:TadE/TadG family type IV pilus assembly protein [Sphingomonas sp. G-3-2-10]|uniref:TadE/TadG family type IV pilus assembly protein n=1 Tax=Sphingomonas sp. G-3-2-10 TaxID=2728838 RepID=UPI00146D09BB|nr:TadE/TadG family type IV pilus assembly protein [Sphingomonas sp. G-3-2-10]NML05383.1 pilus assembly protein TadG [Sphingomonas sp. G-3-2-10]
MSASEDRKLATAPAFLSRLRSDKRGNTLAMMAIALIPLAGMVGGGVDISRMYIVKTRLQHACDAGALAGRKTMGGGVWSQSNYAPRVAAEKFFDSNIQASPYGAESLTKTFTESGGKVSGTASAVLPMTLMRIFGRTTETLTVTCDAEMRLPNTDVMFVLDVTGSMDDKAVSTDTDDKITSLKKSVKCFYEVVANLDTTATCASTPAGGGVAASVQIRFGFMPYSTNVNVGKLLPTSYFANTWPYQSRKANFRTETTTNWVDSGITQTGTSDSPGNWGSWNNADSSTNTTATSSSNCQTKVPASVMTLSGNESGRRDQTTTGTNPTTTSWNTRQSATWVEYSYRDYRSSDGRCRFYSRTSSSTNGYYYRYYSYTTTGTTTSREVFDNYTYAKMDKDISGLKNGTSWNSSFQSAVGYQGADKTINWNGCIEERKTAITTNFSPIPAGANDLNIDMVPNQSNPDSLWGPVLPDIIYNRRVSNSGWGYTGSLSLDPITTTDEYVNYSSTYCPREARKLATWNTASTFEAYVDSLAPTGNTYHDIGLIWGARFMSAEGIFASENATTPSGGDIARHMIFMTDGDACTGVTNYTAYGIAWWDRRQTPSGTTPTDGCSTTGNLTEQVNLRSAALCTAIKNKNITLWVIWFGVSNPTIETMLRTCATDGRFFTARNSADLQQTFSSIASQISQLRLTR